MYKYNRKKEIIKNVVYIGFILAIAVVSTYYIYNKFQDDRELDFNSESLEVTYHERAGNKLNITRITPVTDSVGLSSKSTTISIKNNLTEPVQYKIEIQDDLEKIVEDECEENQITKEDIKLSVKVNKKNNKIYTLDEIEDGVILTDEIAALEENNISIRVWIKQESTLPVGSKMHYHGIVKVIEEKELGD